MNTEFKVGNEKIVFDWDVRPFASLLRKGKKLQEQAKENFQKSLADVSNDEMGVDKMFSLLSDSISSIYLGFGDDFIAKGEYDFSINKLKNDRQFSECMKEIGKLKKQLEKKLEEIQYEVEQKIRERELNKATRGRVVGGGFGIGGFIKGALTAGIINGVTGLAYSATNAVGNYFDGSSAESASRTAYKEFNEAVMKGYDETCSEVIFIALDQLGVYYSLDTESSSMIVENIRRGMVPDNVVKKALLKAIHDNPYNRMAYATYVFRFPNDEDDLLIVYDTFMDDKSWFIDRVNKFDGYYFKNPNNKQIVSKIVKNSLIKPYGEKYGSYSDKYNEWYAKIYSDLNGIYALYYLKIADEFIQFIDKTLESIESGNLSGLRDKEEVLSYFKAKRSSIERVKIKTLEEGVAPFEVIAYCSDQEEYRGAFHEGFTLRKMTKDIQVALTDYAKYANIQPYEVLYVLTLNNDEFGKHYGLVVTYDTLFVAPYKQKLIKIAIDDILNASVEGKYTDGTSNGMLVIKYKNGSTSTFMFTDGNPTKRCNYYFDQYGGYDTLNHYLELIFKQNRHLSEEDKQKIFERRAGIGGIDAEKQVFQKKTENNPLYRQLVDSLKQNEEKENSFSNALNDGCIAFSTGQMRKIYSEIRNVIEGIVESGEDLGCHTCLDLSSNKVDQAISEFGTSSFFSSQKYKVEKKDVLLYLEDGIIVANGLIVTAKGIYTSRQQEFLFENLTNISLNDRTITVTLTNGETQDIYKCDTVKFTSAFIRFIRYLNKRLPSAHITDQVEVLPLDEIAENKKQPEEVFDQNVSLGTRLERGCVAFSNGDPKKIDAEIRDVIKGIVKRHDDLGCHTFMNLEAKKVDEAIDNFGDKFDITKADILLYLEDGIFDADGIIITAKGIQTSRKEQYLFTNLKRIYVKNDKELCVEEKDGSQKNIYNYSRSSLTPVFVNFINYLSKRLPAVKPERKPKILVSKEEIERQKDLLGSLPLEELAKIAICALRGKDGGCVMTYGNIPDKKIRDIKESYMKGQNNVNWDEIYLVYADGFWGKANKGFMMSCDGFFSSDGKHYTYDKLSRIVINKGQDIRVGFNPSGSEIFYKFEGYIDNKVRPFLEKVFQCMYSPGELTEADFKIIEGAIGKFKNRNE